MKGDGMARYYPNEEQAISNLQRYLRQLSYFDEDINHVVINGVWNDETRNALLTFQRKNGLSPTGTADEQTWNLLFSQYKSSIDENSPPSPISFFPREPIGQSIGLGDEGFIVSVIQYMLNEISILYDNLENVEINGFFDEATQAAVSEFQKRNLFPQSGRVDKRTWDRLVISYENILNSQ